MSEYHPSSPELQFVPLTPEQAELVADYPEATKELGHVAMEGVELVGVVPATETDAAHFVNLDSDVGTRINVTSDTEKAQENYERYGSPDAAAERLYGEAPVSTEEAAEGSTLAEAAEAAGLTDMLRQYDGLEDAIRTLDRINAENVNDLRQDIINLQQALDGANGPWAGNSIQDHPELISQIDAVSQSMANQVVELDNRVKGQQHETSHYVENVAAAGREVAPLGDEADQALFTKTFDQVSTSLEQLANTDADAAAVNLLRNVVDVLSSLRTESHLSISDVQDTTGQLMAMLETAQQQLTHMHKLDAVSENISALEKLTRGTA